MNYSLMGFYDKMTGGESLNRKTSTEIAQACVNKHTLLSFLSASVNFWRLWTKSNGCELIWWSSAALLAELKKTSGPG